jgi:hypothetical protein
MSGSMSRLWISTLPTNEVRRGTGSSLSATVKNLAWRMLARRLRCDRRYARLSALRIPNPWI